ncbi:Inhibitor of apoptosis 4 [Globisporangium polare]
MATEQVFLRCTKEGNKLRVRIISPGYFRDANCQFPRSIRSESQLYAVAPRSIRLVQTRGGRNFYRVAQPITLCGDDDHDDVAQGDDKATDKSKKQTGGKRRQRPVEKPKNVFDHKDEPDCVVCLDAEKEQIFVPCGHFCMCKACIKQLVQPKKCPICREPIKATILPSEL